MNRAVMIRLLPVGAAFGFPVRQGGMPARSGPGRGDVWLETTPPPCSNHTPRWVWLGRSEPTHECDVSPLPHVVAEILRDGGGGSSPSNGWINRS